MKPVTVLGVYIWNIATCSPVASKSGGSSVWGESKRENKKEEKEKEKEKEKEREREREKERRGREKEREKNRAKERPPSSEEGGRGGGRERHRERQREGASALLLCQLNCYSAKETSASLERFRLEIK